MRIGLVAPPWLPVPPPQYGGTETVVDLLARGFAAAGHQVLLYTTGDSTSPVPKRWVFRHAEPDLLGRSTLELRHLIHAYRALDEVDIVHDHTVLGPLYARTRPNLPVVTTQHGPFDDEMRDIYRVIAERVPVIAISHHQAATAGDIPIARVIHHGVDPAAFPVGAGQGGYLACLGRMTPDKGIREAIVLARQAGLPLRVAAKNRDPAERDYFHTEIEPLLGGDIEYVGEVGGTDKLQLLGDAVALLNPLRWAEPFGLVMVEALACGTPVIATCAGAAPEIVTDGVTGYLRPEPEDLLGVLGCLDRLDRAACRAAVEGHFSSRRMAEEHLAFYAGLLG